MTDREAKPRERYRCPICGQYPKVTKEGALRRHMFPWYHEREGETCPASGTIVTQIPGQLALLEEEPH